MSLKTELHKRKSKNPSLPLITVESRFRTKWFPVCRWSGPKVLFCLESFGPSTWIFHMTFSRLQSATFLKAKIFPEVVLPPYFAKRFTIS